MSRAAQQQTRNLTDQQLAQQNQLISQSNQQGQQDRSSMPDDHQPAEQPGLHAAAAVRDHAAKPRRRQHRIRRAPPARRQSHRRHQQFRRLRRPHRATRTRAGPNRRQPGAAKSNRLRQPKVEGKSRRPQRPRPNLRHRHQSPRQSHGRPVRIAKRPPARLAKRAQQPTSGLFGLGSSVASLFG